MALLPRGTVKLWLNRTVNGAAQYRCLGVGCYFFPCMGQFVCSKIHVIPDIFPQNNIKHLVGITINIS